MSIHLRTDPLQEHGVILTITERLAIAAQIASGMDHVASFNIIHRDLAAETCLLSISNIVKVGYYCIVLYCIVLY